MTEKLTTRYDMEPQNTTPSHTNGLSLEQLHVMKLPRVPEHLYKRVRVNWEGKADLPAASAVDASVDNHGQPLVILTLLMKKSKRTGEFRYVHEESIPHQDIFREIQNYIEMAEEEIREEKWVGL